MRKLRNLSLFLIFLILCFFSFNCSTFKENWPQIIITATPNPVPGTLINDKTEKQWEISITFANQGTGDILIDSATYTLTTSYGTVYNGEMYVGPVRIQAFSNATITLTISSGTTGSAPLYTAGDMVIEFKGKIISGGSVSATLGISLT